MFEGERPRGPRAPSSQGTKIFVSNLDFKVTKEDIGELFEAIGPLASHDIHWDASGRSAGTGEAVFKARADAEVAMQRYNNLQLDGRAMSLTLIEKMERAPSGSVGRRLKSGLTLSAAPGSGPRVVSVTRSLGQAVGAATSQARGRGSLRSVVAMQE
jgi:THO complex subunit 4